MRSMFALFASIGVLRRSAQPSAICAGVELCPRLDPGKVLIFEEARVTLSCSSSALAGETGFR